jgi:exopolysaccharide biosynthesis polyprenyl glycosylphosphotransferase
MTGRVAVEHVGNNWFVVLPIDGVSAFSPFMLLKRLADVIVSVLGLAFLLVLLPFVALAIYLESPGPIFYSQERVGRAGRIFQLIKLRSMVHDAEQDGQPRWAEENDERVTWVGRFLRRTRLDELPQCLNVLRGEMSLVGPRPERPEFVAELQKSIPFYRSRLAARPGMTGWAQVNYHYGNSVEDALVKLQYDLYYLKHQSLYLDLLILLKTIGVVLSFQGT